MALDHIRTSVKEKIVPLLFIPPIEFDFETRKDKKTVDEHIRPFIDRYTKRWGNQPAWLGLHSTITEGRMSDGRHPFDYILDGLYSNHAHAMPVLTFENDADTITAAARAIARDGYGIAFRVRLENLISEDFEDEVTQLRGRLSVSFGEIDLIIDLWSPNFEPYQDFANALIALMKNIRDLEMYRNVVLISSAIPDSFASIKKGVDEIPRHDWLFYNVLINSLPIGMRRSVYGDYTVVHPGFKIIDYRMVDSPSKIVYTTPKTWGICKGESFRSHPEQMIEHCKTVVDLPQFHFRGAGFSYGDEYIAQYSLGEEGRTNLTRWKAVMINHHISTVVDQLSNTFGSS